MTTARKQTERVPWRTAVLQLVLYAVLQLVLYVRLRGEAWGLHGTHWQRWEKARRGNLWGWINSKRERQTLLLPWWLQDS